MSAFRPMLPAVFPPNDGGMLKLQRVGVTHLTLPLNTALALHSVGALTDDELEALRANRPVCFISAPHPVWPGPFPQTVSIAARL